MVMEVLQNRSQITNARQELISKGASSMGPSVHSLLRRVGLMRGVSLGDPLKSWDVLATLKFIEQRVGKNDPILDIGCYASELIVALHKLGYSKLTGADLNTNLQQMPYKESIRYEITDIMQTKFDDASFKVITSISVIEHGFDGQALLKEMSRLLKPGGYFTASFDYWPEEIDTTGITFFGMDWKIFSQQNIADFVVQAAVYGLFPCGELHYGVQEKPIRCGGKQYTFGWLALEKRAQS